MTEVLSSVTTFICKSSLDVFVTHDQFVYFSKSSSHLSSFVLYVHLWTKLVCLQPVCSKQKCGALVVDKKGVCLLFFGYII